MAIVVEHLDFRCGFAPAFATDNEDPPGSRDRAGSNPSPTVVDRASSHNQIETPVKSPVMPSKEG